MQRPPHASSGSKTKPRRPTQIGLTRAQCRPAPTRSASLLVAEFDGVSPHGDNRVVTIVDVDAWENELAERPLLELDENSAVAIKRDVRRFDVDGDGLRFAKAFARTMTDPERNFGLISVTRTHANQARSFSVGERFQGRFCLARAAVEQNWLGRVGGSGGAKWLVRWLERSALVRRIENDFTSDYGEIVRLELERLPAVLEYRYLKGSYIAGGSTFEVTSTGENQCRVTQTWLYQEIHPRYVKWVGTDVMRMHLAVVYDQIQQASEQLGCHIESSDVPMAYLANGGLR